jgi:hypothetical protein
MALSGAYLNPNGTAVQLSTLVPDVVKKLDIKSNPSNANTVYIGPATVQTDGIYAYIALAKGEAYGVEAEGGDQISLGADQLYIQGTSTDIVHISYVI